MGSPDRIKIIYAQSFKYHNPYSVRQRTARFFCAVLSAGVWSYPCLSVPDNQSGMEKVNSYGIILIWVCPENRNFFEA